MSEKPANKPTPDAASPELLLRPVSFVAVLRGVFRSRAIFAVLPQQSWWRTLWHLLLMSSLCAIFILAFRGRDIYRLVAEPVAGFAQNFGRVEASDLGVVPSLNPEQARSVKLAPDLTIYYAASPFSLPLPKEFNRGETAVLWVPQGLLILRPLDNAKEFNTMRLYWSESLPDNKKVAQSDLAEYIKQSFATAKALGNLAELQIRVQGINWQLEHLAGGIWYSVGMSLLVLAMVWALLLSGLFAVVMSNFWRPRPYQLPFTAIFKIGIYAGFPVMLIASCFPAWQLPVMEYQTVYSLGLMIYMLLIVRHLELQRFIAMGGMPQKKEI